jgi:hypothetical protein
MRIGDIKLGMVYMRIGDIKLGMVDMALRMFNWEWWTLYAGK